MSAPSLTEPGDRFLLMGLKPARLLAASEGARSLGEPAAAEA